VGQGASLSELQDPASDEDGVHDESGDSCDCHEQDLSAAAWVQPEVNSHEQCGAGDANL